MRIYELTANGYETESVPQVVFDESNVYSCQIHENELRILCDVSSEFLFPTLGSWISILIQDIHSEMSCGVLSVEVPVGEGFDTIIYIVRFSEREFEKIKKIYLTTFPK